MRSWRSHHCGSVTQCNMRYARTSDEPHFPANTHSLSLFLSKTAKMRSTTIYHSIAVVSVVLAVPHVGVVRAANRQHCPLTRSSVSPTSHISSVCCIPMYGENVIHTLNLKSHNQNCQKQKNGRKELKSKSTEHDTKRYYFDCFGLDCCNSLKHLLTRYSTLRMRYVKSKAVKRTKH